MLSIRPRVYWLNFVTASSIHVALLLQMCEWTVHGKGLLQSSLAQSLCVLVAWSQHSSSILFWLLDHNIPSYFQQNALVYTKYLVRVNIIKLLIAYKIVHTISHCLCSNIIIIHTHSNNLIDRPRYQTPTTWFMKLRCIYLLTIINHISTKSS